MVAYSPSGFVEPSHFGHPPSQIAPRSTGLANVDRGRSYSLRPSEIHTLTEVGKFRLIGVDDLAKFIYAGARARMGSDLRSLGRQELVEQRGTNF